MEPSSFDERIGYSSGNYLRSIRRMDDYCFVLYSDRMEMKIVWASTGEREIISGEEVADFSATEPPPRSQELCSKCRIPVIRMKSKLGVEFFACPSYKLPLANQTRECNHPTRRLETATPFEKEEAEAKEYWQWMKSHKGPPPKWAKKLIPPEYLTSEFTGQVEYCSYGRNSETSDIQRECPWSRFLVFPAVSMLRRNKAPLSTAVLIVYRGMAGGVETHDPNDHSKWDPIHHVPRSLPPLLMNTVWQETKRETMNLTTAQQILAFQTNIVSSPSLTLEEKKEMLAESSTVASERHARYERAKERKEKEEVSDIAEIVKSMYVGRVSLKDGIDDSAPTIYISMIPKKLIQLAQMSTRERQIFFCDGTFKVVQNLQLVILGFARDKDEREAGPSLIPVGVLFTNRKTTDVYRRFFKELKRNGLELGSGCVGMSDMESAISKGATQVYPESDWHICWFHVKMNITEKLEKLRFQLPLRNGILAQIDKIHAQVEHADAKKVWRELKTLLETTRAVPEVKTALKEFIDYFEKWYLPTVDRWLTFIADGKPVDATNNYMENFNNFIKSVILRRRSNLQIAEVVKALENYFQVQEMRYSYLLNEQEQIHSTSESDENLEEILREAEILPPDPSTQSDGTIVVPNSVPLQRLSMLLSDNLQVNLGGKRKSASSKRNAAPNHADDDIDSGTTTKKPSRQTVSRKRKEQEIISNLDRDEMVSPIPTMKRRTISYPEHLQSASEHKKMAWYLNQCRTDRDAEREN